jgi:signal peptidase II
MAEAFRENRVSGLRLWGGLSALTLAIAALMFGLDQTVKWWLLHAVQLADHSPVVLLPVFDLTLTWNRGISYGMFRSDTQGVLVAIGVVLSLALWLWASRTPKRLTAAAIGLIIGGALSNALDRLVYGAVADFFHFHVGSFSWYVFNPADVGIVAGAALLLYESYQGRPAASH